MIQIISNNLLDILCLKGNTIMILKSIKRLKRLPISAIAVLLFAAVITMIICALHASNEAELRNYEEVWQSVPITVTVTDPKGGNDGKLLIKSWVLDLFERDEPIKIYDASNFEKYDKPSEFFRTEVPVELSLTEYVKDVQVFVKRPIDTINGTNFTSAAGTTMLYGITSIPCDKQLLPEYGCQITWYEGYDENVFSGDELLCIVPEGMVENYDKGGEVDLYLTGNSGTPVFRLDENGEQVMKDGHPIIDFPKTEYNCTLKIVGTYTEGDGKSIYCPYSIVKQVYDELGEIIIVRSLSATLKDNRRLDEFREKMSLCFLEPAPDGKKTSWGGMIDVGLSTKYTEKSYAYAIDIDDNNLFDLSAILEDSIKFNRTVTVFVVILSVISGFLVGFLMVRRRKREILLMRMVGESNARVYVGFALEQMICIILGIAIGGAYYMWNPMDKLAIFAVAYFVALSFALVIFMSKKLIRNVKEDE